MTTSPPQPPQNPFPGQPGDYGPPPEQFPQYTQPEPQSQQPGQAYEQQPFQQAPPQQGQPYPQQGQPYARQGQSFPQQDQFGHQGQQGQFGQPQPYPAAPQMGLQCRFCGSFPAVDATVRGHQGMIVVMRFLKLRGPFCRSCGIASVRDMTAKSMWQGWWGLGSSIINPITMLMNIGPMQKFKGLPEPLPGAPGQPMDPGKPLLRRAPMLVLLLPVLAIVLVVIAGLASLATTSPSEAAVGACVMNKGTASDPRVRVVDCAGSEAEYKIAGKLENTTDDSQCDQFEGVEASYTVVDGSTEYTLCLAPL